MFFHLKKKKFLNEKTRPMSFFEVSETPKKFMPISQKVSCETFQNY